MGSSEDRRADLSPFLGLGDEPGSASEEAIATILSLLAIAFLIWLITLSLKPHKRSRE